MSDELHRIILDSLFNEDGSPSELSNSIKHKSNTELDDEDMITYTSEDVNGLIKKIRELNHFIEDLSSENSYLKAKLDAYENHAMVYCSNNQALKIKNLEEENDALKNINAVLRKAMVEFESDQLRSTDTFNHISWDEYFMGVAQMVKSRSKDPSTKVGACIVRNNRIISTGYNGFPFGCDDDKYPWTKEDSDDTRNKYFYVTHAELNAILNARQSVEGSTVYVTLFPCNECAKAIIQSGIKKVVYKEINDSTEEKARKNAAVFKMFTDANVEVVLYCPGNKTIKIEV